jgi:7,8-dihydropterin-6-yl-methyl-4-(beta-D-ribofuranosyl)aminobenzene 5'-phosphate synthase
MDPTCGCPPGRSPFSRGGFGRRQALRATGIGFVAALAGILTDAGRVAQAQPVAGHVPVVDRLSVRIVTDVYTDPNAAPLKTSGMKVERVGRTEKPNIPPHTTLRAEWGLSMLAESARRDETRRVLVDFGYSPEVLLTNMGLLGIDPAMVDALVLSHGHFDHFGGLMGLLAAAKGKLKPDLPLFVGGEDCFCARQIGDRLDYGVLDRPGILAAGIKLMMAEGPAIVADHAVTSGQIPKTTYEDPLRSTSERIGITDGLGCDPALEPATKNTGTYIPDDFQHEIATSYVVKDRGLVVLTSCSHRGVLNTIKQALASAGTDRLHAVIGGFHLVPPLTDDYVRRSVTELKAMNPDFVVPAHCAGERFYDIARAEMPGRILRSVVGTRVTFGV